MRSITRLVVPLLVAGSAGLAAQEAPASLCYKARPKPACSSFAFTNFGAYLIVVDELGGTPLREVADWGVMLNVGRRNAVGFSVFASLDETGFVAGPAARYRRWLSSVAALEVAVGTPMARSTQNIESGSVFGLARWNPNNWLALAVRPEVLHKPTVLGCGPTSCTIATRSHTRVSLGAELGRVPGAALTGVAGVTTLLLYLAVASAIND